MTVHTVHRAWGVDGDRPQGRGVYRGACVLWTATSWGVDGDRPQGGGVKGRGGVDGNRPQGRGVLGLHWKRLATDEMPLSVMSCHEHVILLKPWIDVS